MSVCVRYVYVCVPLGVWNRGRTQSMSPLPKPERPSLFPPPPTLLSLSPLETKLPTSTRGGVCRVDTPRALRLPQGEEKDVVVVVGAGGQ
jgi:hypothetical protein